MAIDQYNYMYTSVIYIYGVVQAQYVVNSNFRASYKMINHHNGLSGVYVIIWESGWVKVGQTRAPAGFVITISYYAGTPAVIPYICTRHNSDSTR